MAGEQNFFLFFFFFLFLSKFLACNLNFCMIIMGFQPLADKQEAARWFVKVAVLDNKNCSVLWEVCSRFVSWNSSLIQVVSYFWFLKVRLEIDWTVWKWLSLVLFWIGLELLDCASQNAHSKLDCSSTATWRLHLGAYV